MKGFLALLFLYLAFSAQAVSQELLKSPIDISDDATAELEGQLRQLTAELRAFSSMTDNHASWPRLRELNGVDSVSDAMAATSHEVEAENEEALAAAESDADMKATSVASASAADSAETKPKTVASAHSATLLAAEQSEKRIREKERAITEKLLKRERELRQIEERLHHAQQSQRQLLQQVERSIDLARKAQLLKGKAEAQISAMSADNSDVYVPPPGFAGSSWRGTHSAGSHRYERELEESDEPDEATAFFKRAAQRRSGNYVEPYYKRDLARIRRHRRHRNRREHVTAQLRDIDAEKRDKYYKGTVQYRNKLPSLDAYYDEDTHTTPKPQSHHGVSTSGVIEAAEGTPTPVSYPTLPIVPRRHRHHRHHHADDANAPHVTRRHWSSRKVTVTKKPLPSRLKAQAAAKAAADATAAEQKYRTPEMREGDWELVARAQRIAKRNAQRAKLGLPPLKARPVQYTAPEYVNSEDLVAPEYKKDKPAIGVHGMYRAAVRSRRHSLKPADVRKRRPSAN